jgi:hypothetical protein
MASELKVDKFTGVTTAGSISVTGEGNSTTTNLQQGLAKVWVNFDGTSSGAAARDSFNVSGQADNGTGDYTTSFTNNMNNDDYAAPEGTNEAQAELKTLATGSLRLETMNSSGSSSEKDTSTFAVLGDLA